MRGRILFVTGSFPATTPASVIFQVASAADSGWNVHVLADEPGGEAGWKLAEDLRIPRDIVTISKWRAASPLPRSRRLWGAGMSQAANRAGYGHMLSLRRR